MNTITNKKINVEYSDGASTKAKNQLDRLSAMDDFYKDHPLECKVLLLDKKDWEEQFPIPYGLPFVELEEIPMVVLPATEDGVIVQAILPYEPISPDKTNELLNSINYSFKDAVSLFPDLIGCHEIGHIFTEGMGYKELNHWLNEFMATYFAFCYFKENETDMATLWIANAHVRYLDGDKPEYTTMDSFDAIYCEMPVANYDWYQKEFALIADKIYKEFGLSFFDEFGKHVPKKRLSTKESFDYLKKFTDAFEYLKEY